jgi:hypothetical protein
VVFYGFCCSKNCGPGSLTSIGNGEFIVHEEEIMTSLEIALGIACARNQIKSLERDWSYALDCLGKAVEQAELLKNPTYLIIGTIYDVNEQLAKIESVEDSLTVARNELERLERLEAEQALIEEDSNEEVEQIDGSFLDDLDVVLDF